MEEVMMSETVLVTGGAGYIGSHTALALHAAGHEVVVIDNFVNSKPGALDVVSDITGKDITVVEGDARDVDLVEKTLRDNNVTAVIHLSLIHI